MSDELLSIDATHDGRRGLLRATGDHVVFDVRTRGKWGDRTVDVPITEIRSIDVDEIRAESSRRKAGLIGIWAREKVEARSGILLVCADGRRLLFVVDGSALETRAASGRLLDLIGS